MARIGTCGSDHVQRGDCWVKGDNIMYTQRYTYSGGGGGGGELVRLN